ncbi:proline racemase family protein [candidate division KSB1 bacterium]
MFSFYSDSGSNALDWKAPENWVKITAIEAHTEGEPLRVIIGGYPEIKGDTILEKRRYAKENLDYLRTALMWEPRGHADMYGCLLAPPVTSDADFGVIFLHNEGYSTMCGHGIIGVTKVVLQTGMIPIKEPETVVKIDTPAGLVTAFAKIEDNEVKSISFHNVPSFVYTLDENVEITGLGNIKIDIAFGGAFYAFVDADELGISLNENNFRKMIDIGSRIKRTVMNNIKITHPFEEDLNFLYGTIFTGSPDNTNNHSRNVCVFAEGEVDRSPTGTGVSARLALHYTRNEIELGQKITIESIIGSTFSGKVISETKFGQYDAVIPEVEGTAFIIGQNTFLIDPEDNLKNGFILR